MANFRPYNRNQKSIFPSGGPDDWLAQDHMARFIVDVVEQLDFSAFVNQYGGRGVPAYHPKLLTTLMFYGYATGVFSSRKIERATWDSVAFRFIAQEEHPDHDTICNFRKKFLPQLSAMFLQVLQVAHKMEIYKLGKVALDGTKVKANASKHAALSHGHCEKLEKQLKEEIEQLMQLAEEADNTEVPDGMVIPDEIALRKDKLDVIASAVAEIEARAKVRYKREKKEYDEKMAERAAKEEETGKKIPGKVPKEPEPGARSRDQVNLTDKESRIMPQSGGGFQQAYNAQASVDIESMIVVATHVTQNTNDKLEITPALDELLALPETLGKVDSLIADAGYFSEENVKKCEEVDITPYICVGREKHNKNPIERFIEPEPPPDGASVVDKMKYLLTTKAGRAVYAVRKCTVEPVFGIIKAVLGFRQFSLRGFDAVSGEWDLVCLAWNLKRMHKLSLQKIQ